MFVKPCRKAGLYFYSASGGARFQQVQVLNPPGSGKDIAEGKGVHREVESEGYIKKITGMLYAFF